MKIIYLISAKQDLYDGVEFYNQQDKGLGLYFLESIYSDIDSLRLFPKKYSVHFDGFYRMLTKRFPYAIYYTINNEQIEIFAVIDTRRNPNWIAKFLQAKK